MREYLLVDENTPRGRKASVRFCDYRKEKAVEQALLPKVERTIISKYISEFLSTLSMPTKKSYMVSIDEKEGTPIDYNAIKEENNLQDIRDIVWIKFTEDGHVGVVATSNDINFNIPETEQDYYDKKFNSSGILIHQLKKRWDREKLLIVPLVSIPQGLRRGDIERGIGNYLVSKGVPILDYYSHNY